jgi:tetratricopeptide (TPR) repeat protein
MLLVACLAFALISAQYFHRDVYYGAAERALAAGDYDAAQRALAAALATEPSGVRAVAAHSNRCGCLHKLRRDAEALAACDAALALASERGEHALSADITRGSILIALRRPGEAIAPLTRACAASPTHGGARLNLGSALFAAGDFAGAETAFRVALALAGDDDAAASDAALNLGRALEGLGALDGARREYHRAALLDPQHSSARQRSATARLAPHTVARGARVGSAPRARRVTALARVATVWEVGAVLSPAECAAVADAAEAHAAANGGWLTDGHHEHYRTIDLVAAEIPALLPLFEGTRARSAAGVPSGGGGGGLVAQLLAEVAGAFPRACAEGATLWLKDLFVVRYEADGGGGARGGAPADTDAAARGGRARQAGLTLHRDGSRCVVSFLRLVPLLCCLLLILSFVCGAGSPSSSPSVRREWTTMGAARASRRAKGAAAATSSSGALREAPR